MDNKVLDEAVQMALCAWFNPELNYPQEAMRAALLAALPVLLGPVVAYETVTPTDDPDVFDAKLWAAAPGMAIPEGAIKLYAPSLGEGE